LDHNAHSVVNNIPNGGVGVSSGAAAAETATAAGSVAHSTGTLSVGTMGADLESNDEDSYDDGDDDEDDGASGGEGGGDSVASSWVTSLPSLSSHLRRRRCMGLNHTNNGTGQRQAVWPSSAFGTTTSALFSAAGLPVINSNRHNPSVLGRDIDGADEDDAATCAAMTTAAVAPRRHRNRSSPSSIKAKRKKRAIGFVIDTSPRDRENSDCIAMKEAAAEGGMRNCSMDMNSCLEIQQQARQPIRRGNLKIGDMRRRKSDELEVEELEVDCLSLDGNEATFTTNQNDQINGLNRLLREQDSTSPPLDCIPDPLLVAAQHAAGEGMGTGTSGGHPTLGSISKGGRGATLKDPPDAPFAGVGAYGSSSEPTPDASNNNWSLLVMGDCCSSVTEEENSLAEDEASLSAISIGGITTLSTGGDIGTVGTVSGLSAGGTHGGAESEASMADPASIGGMSDGMGGSYDRKLPQLAPHPENDHIRRSADPMERTTFSNGSKLLLETKDQNILKPLQCSRQPDSAVAQKADNSVATNGYASLNQMLGTLHNERRHRRQANFEFGKGGFRRDSSIFSLGSECTGFGTGTGRLLSRGEERSYSSLPGNIITSMDSAVHWNAQQKHPPTHIQSTASHTIANAPNFNPIDGAKSQEMDIEMEAATQSGAVAAAGGSLDAGACSISGSLTGSCANFSRTSMGSNGPPAADCEIVKYGQTAAPAPKWKRQVKLPSHSSLF